MFKWKHCYTYIPIILLLILLSFNLCGCHNIRPVSKSGIYFDTTITITIYDASRKDVLIGCMDLAKYYENMLSISIPGSDIYKINHSGGAPVEVQEDTLFLLNKAIYYANLSHGIVDPTIGTVSFLWKDAMEKQVLPDSIKLEKALSHVNYNNIQIQGCTVSLLDPDAQIDLGFIAKGFIADQIKSYLEEYGITSGIINLGGNVLTIGTKPDGKSYSVGIQRPFSGNGEYAHIVSVNNKSVVSSGVYERYMESHGKYYHHIIDSQTGYPTTSDLYSATIISDSSLDGDALSTICLALGSTKGQDFINSLNQTLNTDIQAIFITSDYDLIISSDLQ